MLDTGEGILSLTDLDSRNIRELRRNAQMIFQDPNSSLNPRMNILETVGEPLLVNKIASGRELEERVREMILQVDSGSNTCAVSHTVSAADSDNASALHVHWWSIPDW